MEKSSWDVIAQELYFILEATLDGCCEHGTVSEQEKVVISGSRIRGLSIRRGRTDFHSAETGGHFFEAVVGEELVLEEVEEPKEGGIWWDFESVDEDKGIVSDKHLG